MSAAVAILPTRNAVDAAFVRYAELVQQCEADTLLRINLDHNIAIARAWAEWRDLFLAWDRRCK
jgi:hypothetical protein